MGVQLYKMCVDALVQKNDMLIDVDVVEISVLTNCRTVSLALYLLIEL